MRKLFAVSAIVASLAFTPSAFAQSTYTSQYGSTNCTTVTQQTQRGDNGRREYNTRSDCTTTRNHR